MLETRPIGYRCLPGLSKEVLQIVSTKMAFEGQTNLFVSRSRIRFIGAISAAENLCSMALRKQLPTNVSSKIITLNLAYCICLSVDM